MWAFELRVSLCLVNSLVYNLTRERIETHSQGLSICNKFYTTPQLKSVSYITTFFTNHLLLMHWLNSILRFFTSTFHTDKYKNATNASNCSNGIKCLNTSLTNWCRARQRQRIQDTYLMSVQLAERSQIYAIPTMLTVFKTSFFYYNHEAKKVAKRNSFNVKHLVCLGFELGLSGGK